MQTDPNESWCTYPLLYERWRCLHLVKAAIISLRIFLFMSNHAYVSQITLTEAYKLGQGTMKASIVQSYLKKKNLILNQIHSAFFQTCLWHCPGLMIERSAFQAFTWKDSKKSNYSTRQGTRIKVVYLGNLI